MIPVPSLSSPMVGQGGRVIPPWNSYLQQFTQAPPKFMSVDVGASPFAYTAREPGYIVVLGGIVSAIHLIRGTDDLNLTGQKIIPVSIADTVEVTYTGLPTITFVPTLGANTLK